LLVSDRPSKTPVECRTLGKPQAPFAPENTGRDLTGDLIVDSGPILRPRREVSCPSVHRNTDLEKIVEIDLTAPLLPHAYAIPRRSRWQRSRSGFM
jgi:hypothetical protein